MASDPHKVLISYGRDSPQHERRVLALSNELRTQGGVDAWIDRYFKKIESAEAFETKALKKFGHGGDS